ncbi:MAG: hypothetical protein HY063_04245 [Bacteroidetes bacterium]|nr:hypothetical protein [Bacteroidota bacterium]
MKEEFISLEDEKIIRDSYAELLDWLKERGVFAYKLEQEGRKKGIPLSEENDPYLKALEKVKELPAAEKAHFTEMNILFFAVIMGRLQFAGKYFRSAITFLEQANNALKLQGQSFADFEIYKKSSLYQKYKTLFL